MSNTKTAEDVKERCHAGKDGECHHKECPQIKDNEPMKSGRHCPIDTWEEDGLGYH